MIVSATVIVRAAKQVGILSHVRHATKRVLMCVIRILNLMIETCEFVPSMQALEHNVCNTICIRCMLYAYTINYFYKKSGTAVFTAQ